MFEVKVTILAPELAAAISHLATSIGGAKLENAVVPMTPPTNVSTAVTTAPAALPGVSPINTSAPATYPAVSPSIPLAQPPQYTVDQIMTAGAALMDAGRVNELIHLLHSFGVQAVTDLKQEQLGAFATAMRELGAKI